MVWTNKPSFHRQEVMRCSKYCPEEVLLDKRSPLRYTLAKGRVGDLNMEIFIITFRDNYNSKR